MFEGRARRQRLNQATREIEWARQDQGSILPSKVRGEKALDSRLAGKGAGLRSGMGKSNEVRGNTFIAAAGLVSNQDIERARGCMVALS